MIIEVDISTLEVRVNGRKVGTTTTEKMHNCRDYAREHINLDGGATYYTILDGKIASQHDIERTTAWNISDYLLGVADGY